ncbi:MULTISPECIES: DUF932 domain-containing protein [Halorussus]|uniref:DUF932 domain-containing protein n=1 Tax=Halorussus TaxID=1070314 RepID=UPI00209EB41D|nr:DUF932 domain-containing protein [Halorussus vallis]USZ77571.1 DUF932 domain-containing protein [Halorussus vallis]
MREQTYTFDDLDQLYETADQLPQVERHDVYARNEELDEWKKVPWRDSLWTDTGELSGEVSAFEDFYNVIQYGEILDTVGRRLEHHHVEPEGRVSLSPNSHKMTAKIGLGDVVEPREGDEVALQLHARSGHSGYHGLKYSIGAERLICSNGMTGFISEQSYEQTHSERFKPQLAYHAVDSMIEGADTVENRLKEAQEERLLNQDEALLVLHDLGIDRYFENPTADLVNALYEEVEDLEKPSLYETFNAATYALTHLSTDVPEYVLDDGLEQASQLLDQGNNVPDAKELGRGVVENRVQHLVDADNPDEEEYWEGETESLRELMKKHEIQA